jgi:hypothetical protein
MPSRLPLLIILTLYLVLGITYSLATPLGEGPDEPGHIAFIAFLNEQHRLPRHGDSQGPLAQQIKHPPLYYAVGALATAWADLDGLWFRPNPHFSTNIEHAPSPAAHQHLPGEQFPYAEPYLALRIVRWLTVLAGLFAVAATYAVARAVWPDAPHLAWGSAAVIAFLPQFLFMQGMVNNDGLVNVLAALALLAAVRIALGGARRADMVALGLVLGLGLLTKLTFVALVAVGGLAVLSAAYRMQSARVLARAALYTGLPMLLIAGWWFARNLWLNGDLLGWGGWMAVTGDLRREPLLADLPQYFVQQIQSFWGRFGWMSVPLPETLYTLLEWLMAVAAAGLILLVVRSAWRRWNRLGGSVDPRDEVDVHETDRATAPTTDFLGTPDSRWGFALLVATVVLVYASVFRLLFTFDLVVAQGRYLFTALPAMALLFTLGLAAWFPARLQPGAMFALALGMFALAVFALVAFLAPAFSPPPRLTEAELAAIEQRADVDFGPSIRLLGYDLERPRFRPGDTVDLATYWQATGQIDEGYILFAQVLDGQGQVVGQVDVIPQEGRYPTLSWLLDRPFRENLEIPFAEWAAPGPASVIVGLYREGQPDQRLDAARGGTATQPYGNAYLIPIEIASEAGR